MSEQNLHGPQPVPHEAMYFIYVLVGVLALLIAGWIYKTIG